MSRILRNQYIERNLTNIHSLYNFKNIINKILYCSVLQNNILKCCLYNSHKIEILFNLKIKNINSKCLLKSWILLLMNLLSMFLLLKLCVLYLRNITNLLVLLFGYWEKWKKMRFYRVLLMIIHALWCIYYLVIFHFKLNFTKDSFLKWKFPIDLWNLKFDLTKKIIKIKKPRKLNPKNLETIKKIVITPITLMILFHSLSGKQMVLMINQLCLMPIIRKPLSV